MTATAPGRRKVHPPKLCPTCCFFSNEVSSLVPPFQPFGAFDFDLVSRWLFPCAQSLWYFYQKFSSAWSFSAPQRGVSDLISFLLMTCKMDLLLSAPSILICCEHGAFTSSLKMLVRSMLLIIFKVCPPFKSLSHCFHFILCRSSGDSKIVIV